MAKSKKNVPAAARPQIASSMVVTKGDREVLAARGAGAPAAAMLECLVMAAPRTASAKGAGTPGMRRFLNAAMRSTDGVAEVTAYGTTGREVASVCAVREGDA